MKERLILVVAVLISVACTFQYAEMSQVFSNTWSDGAVMLSDDYRALLNREKEVLKSGPGPLDWGNQRFLQHAADEQDRYVSE